MTTVNLSPLAGAGWQFFDNDGVPLAGGLLYTYQAGTSTPQTTYTTSAGNVANSNPIVFNASGRLDNEVWMTQGASYKFVLKTSAGTLVGTYDNLTGINDVTSALADVYAAFANTTDPAKGDALVGFRQSNSSGNLTGAVGRTVHQKLQESISVLDFGADPTGVVGASTAIQAAIDAVSAQGGGSVYFPPGTYLIDGNITPKSNMSIYGAGAASILSFTGNNRQCFTSNSVSNLKIFGLFFDGNKPTVGWETTNNYDFGVRLGSGATGQDIQYVEIYECTFKDIGLDGVSVENFFNVTIRDNNYINCRRWGVVVEPGAHNSSYCNVFDSFFDCDYGGGPVGKEYPLGAVDCEPYLSNTVVYHLIYRNLTGARNDTQMIDQTGNFNSIQNGMMENCIVVDGKLGATNGLFSINNCRVSGDARGEFRFDSGADYLQTSFSNLDVTMFNSFEPKADSGRYNMFPCDFGDPQYCNQTVSQSGTGATNGYFLKYLDGAYVWVQEIQLGPGAGYYKSLRQQIAQNISIGDQVYIFLEIERTDTTTPTNNWLSLDFGAEFSRLMNIPTGVNQLSFAYKATQAATTPTISFGVSGTPGTIVKAIFRKVFVFINPRRIDTSQFAITVEPLPKNVTYTGPSLNAYNLSLASLSIASAQNLDTINGGYPGARLALFCSTSSYAVTVRDVSVGSGNIKLIGGSTQTLQQGASTQSISFVYNSDGYWYQAT